MPNQSNSRRPIRRRVPLAVAAVIALGLAPTVGRAADPVGAVVTLRGAADAFARSDRRSLAPASEVFLEDTVTTAEQSRLEIRLGADTTLRLGEKGRARIARFASTGGTIDLEQGALMVDKAPESSARPLEIDSSFGRIAVRGTRFYAGPSRGVFGVVVLRGRVVVSAAGASVELGEGQGTDIARPGAPPSPATTWGAARVAEALAAVD